MFLLNRFLTSIADYVYSFVYTKPTRGIACRKQIFRERLIFSF